MQLNGDVNDLLGVSFKGWPTNQELIGQNAHSPHISCLSIVGLGPTASRGVPGGTPSQTGRDPHNLHETKTKSPLKVCGGIETTTDVALS